MVPALTPPHYHKPRFFNTKKWFISLMHAACIIWCLYIFSRADENAESSVRQEGKYEEGTEEYAQQVVQSTLFTRAAVTLAVLMFSIFIYGFLCQRVCIILTYIAICFLSLVFSLKNIFLHGHQFSLIQASWSAIMIMISWIFLQELKQVLKVAEERAKVKSYVKAVNTVNVPEIIVEHVDD